jgi:hypothetical protein
MVTMDKTVLDCERGEQHVPIGHSFWLGTTPMGEQVLPKTVLRKVAMPQPISSKGRFGQNFERGLGEHELK